MPDSNVRWLEDQHTPLPKSLTTQRSSWFFMRQIKAIFMPVSCFLDAIIVEHGTPLFDLSTIDFAFLSHPKVNGKTPASGSSALLFTKCAIGRRQTLWGYIPRVAPIHSCHIRPA